MSENQDKKETSTGREGFLDFVGFGAFGLGTLAAVGLFVLSADSEAGVLLMVAAVASFVSGFVVCAVLIGIAEIIRILKHSAGLPYNGKVVSQSSGGAEEA